MRREQDRPRVTSWDSPADASDGAPLARPVLDRPLSDRHDVDRILGQPVGDVDPEAVGAEVEPEPQDVVELFHDIRVRPVPVGLLGSEQVQVPLAGGAVGLGDARPGATAERADPVVGRQRTVVAPAVAERGDSPSQPDTARAPGQARGLDDFDPGEATRP